MEQIYNLRQLDTLAQINITEMVCMYFYWVKQILYLVPSQNLLFFAFIMASIIAFFPPRIWGVRATLKAVLTAVDMK